MDSRRLEEGASFSGHERNHLFMSQDGVDFVEISGVSGLDHPGDSRAFASLDFDRDGWTDVALVGANAPLFQLYRNQLGDRAPSGAGNVVAVKFEGGNRASSAARDWTNRDGFGAKVSLRADDRTLIREHRAGEGMASQNSATMLIGLGESGQATGLSIKWPSGKVTDTVSVPAGTLVTAFENPEDSPTDAPFVFEPYHRSRAPQRTLVASAARPATDVVSLAGDALGGQRGRLVMYTTMATWCAPCLVELPDMQLLRSSFSPDDLEMIGVPYDDEEDTAVLTAWADMHSPAYGILTEVSTDQRAEMRDVLVDRLKLEGLPATMITDGAGNILLTRWGPPTVSEVRKLLRATAEKTDDS